jgi:cobalt-precorrin 5A hydrolase
MNYAIITLCHEGLIIAEKIAAGLPHCHLFVHRDVPCGNHVTRFDRVIALTAEIFTGYNGLIYIMPSGVIVRAVAPMIEHKLKDPAVVAVDVGGRWAVSLLSGHEGGANILSYRVANLINAEPVISTTTEAVKSIIAGVGCRRGVTSAQIIDALDTALKQASLPLSQVRLIASADLKADEQGLLDAARQLDLPLRFISSDEIRQSSRNFTHHQFVKSKVNLPAVAEPAALLAGRRTTLILNRQKLNGVTVALAQEHFMWSE